MSASNVDAHNMSVKGNLCLKGVTVLQPKSGNKIKVGTVSPGLVIAPKGPLQEVTIIFPEVVEDGQVMFLSFTQDVAKLTLTNANFANSSSIGPKVKAGDAITLFYNQPTGKWFKLA